MVEANKMEYVLSRRLLTLLAGLMAGCMISQGLGCLMSYFVIEDSQALMNKSFSNWTAMDRHE
jgi:hypothetical protein